MFIFGYWGMSNRQMFDYDNVSMRINTYEEPDPNHQLLPKEGDYHAYLVLIFIGIILIEQIILRNYQFCF